MMISEHSHLHLLRAEEERITRELERRREQFERSLEDAAAAEPVRDGGRSAGHSWWAGLLHPRARHDGAAAHGHAHAA
ncbi:hypothetical protein [Agromyces sp. Leaf222]|uniref:hypothetical protein n=1 Tax=Agromyces sp. Leaf222 TaxID=1735688 RepID=UPI0006F84682|nr:hypothetical protein [Agromyces sp. Leaf222]KQM81189.1 hypothetical protein ASE68_15380 [Agromyces sp. Leaf222]